MTLALFEPLTLRDIRIRNRIWIPPMCQYSAEKQDGVPTSWHLMHYGSFARGGAGLVTVEATGVVPEGRISPQCLGLWNDEQRDALAGITSLIHVQGAKASIQLGHAGRKGSTARGWPGSTHLTVPVNEGGWQPVGPSPVAFPGLAEPAPLTIEQIDRVVIAFAAAARSAVEAGFDAVELHGAHGYLLHQFLSPASNVRNDEYGGSLENRARLILRVVDAVRAEIGDGVPVIVRLSLTEWSTEGYTPEEIVQVVRWLKEHGVDLISASTGGNLAGVEIPVGPGYQVPLAATLRVEADIPVAAVGMITEPFQAEQIVALGQADAVFVGRESLRDPNFPMRAARALRFDAPHIPPQYARAYL